MRKKNILHAPHIEKLKKRKRKVLKNKIIFSLICFVIIFIGLIFLSRWDKINIENIEISGNEVIETEAIELIVKKNITGYYLWLFPKTNFLLYPQNKIEKELSEIFKRFDTIKVNDKSIKTLEISVSEREGKYLWCGDKVPYLTSDTNSFKCYFMDKDGYIFDEAPYFSGDVYFKFYGGDNNLNIENPSGSYFLKDYFKDIIVFKDNLEKLNFKPKSFFKSLDEGSEDEGFISLFSDPAYGAHISFKLDSNYEKITENFQAAISTEPLQSELKNKFSSLLYIDLRFGNKVYYKFSTKGGSTSDGRQ
ncbi:MAG: hypothetical protein WCX46_02805 [Candidatus Paceibacterota bacterium]